MGTDVAAGEEQAKPGKRGRIVLERRGAVALLTVYNAPGGFMDFGTETALEACLDEIEADGGLRAAVIAGAEPGRFIQHYDVQVLEERAAKMRAKGMRFSTDRHVPEPLYHGCLRRIETSAKPFVCAIGGTAMGAASSLR